MWGDTGQAESWEELAYLWKGKEKPHCRLCASHHLSCILPVLSLFPVPSAACSQSSHPSPLPNGAAQLCSASEEPRAALGWKPLCQNQGRTVVFIWWCFSSLLLKIKGHWCAVSDELFLVSGLTTHVTSVEKRGSCNSWVKVPRVLILEALCVSPITVQCYDCAYSHPSPQPGVFSVFPPPPPPVGVEIMLPLKLHSWNTEISESQKWAELLVGIDQALCFWWENCSKPNILNQPQRMFPKHEELQVASLPRKPLGAISQRACGELKVQKWTRTRQRLPMARHIPSVTAYLLSRSTLRLLSWVCHQEAGRGLC